MRDNAFGPDKNDEPGITAIPGHVVPAQMTDFMVESCVLHSRSQGWYPAITFRILTDDGTGVVCSLAVGENVTKIADDILIVAARAVEDYGAALKAGLLS